MKSGLLREVAYLEMDSLIIFYYYKASETWSDKRGGLLAASNIIVKIGGLVVFMEE
jgi:hypothetical protein